MLGVGLSLTGRLRSSVFSPASLFRASEPGVWYDPSDLTTLFQDTAGTQPVTAAGQTVARVNDKSGGGNHATQATAASRPTYGIVPRTGRRNLLTFTEEFDNAGWVKADTTVTANNAVAPNGTTTADLASASSSGTFRYIRQSLSLTPTTYTLQMAVKSNGTAQWVWLLGETSADTFFWFDIVNGVIGGSGTQTGGAISGQTYNHSIENLGNGWYLCKATFVKTSATKVEEIGFGFSNANASASAAAGQSCLVWGAQLETGSTATAYQRVGSQFDVTEAGVPSLHYLSFDGTDDFLITPTITPGIDKAQVFAGVRKIGTGASTLVEVSADSGTQNGSFGLFAPSGFGNDYFLSSRGSVTQSTTTGANTFVAPITNVLTGLCDISGDRVILRVNGTQAAQSTADQGTGNFLAYPIYIGRRGGTTLPFNGNIFSLVVRFGANLDANTITNTETWVNGKTGAY